MLHIVRLTILSHWAIGTDTLDKDAKLFALLVPSNYHNAQSVGLCSFDRDIYSCKSLSSGGEATASVGGGGGGGDGVQHRPGQVRLRLYFIQSIED